mmetsp:Transcript_105369/g.164303  ORF Transcript_105369/g.164303 Transcript_105369/m.164303 type:complete len:340 (+) Transcript_105369:43-1062(+)
MASTMVPLLLSSIVISVLGKTCSNLDDMPSGSKVELADYSFNRAMNVVNHLGTRLATITADTWSWNVHLKVWTTGGVAVAELENPGVFWDDSSTMYDCNLLKIREFRWKRTNLLLHPQQKDYQIYDQAGVLLGDFVVQRQPNYDLYLLQANGTNVLEFKMEFKSSFEKFLGLWGRYKSASLNFISPVVHPLFLESHFLALAAGFLLAPNGQGPVWLFLPFFLPCLVCVVLCCVAGTVNQGNKYLHQLCEYCRRGSLDRTLPYPVKHVHRDYTDPIRDDPIRGHLDRNKHFDHHNKKGLLAWMPNWMAKACCRRDDTSPPYPGQSAYPIHSPPYPGHAFH